MPWEVHLGAGCVELSAQAASRPLHLTRRAELRDATLRLEYSVKNVANAATQWMWSAHPLLAVEPGDRITLPADIHQLTVAYSADGSLRPGETVAWPLATTDAGERIDLSTVRAADGRTAYKLFSPRLSEGFASIYRSSKGQGLALRFDPHAIPFLGLWICNGAWPEQGSPKQYTVALEPTTANTDSLLKVQGTAVNQRLESQQSFEWWLELDLFTEPAG